MRTPAADRSGAARAAKAPPMVPAVAASEPPSRPPGSGRELPHGSHGRASETPARRPAGSAAAAANGASLPVEAFVPGPIVRVGIIVDGARSVVTGGVGLIVREAGPLAHEVPLARATFVAVAPTAAGSRFRVQVGSLPTRGARKTWPRVRDMASGVVTRWSDETRTWQVRVGDFRRATRPRASSRLQQLGLRRMDRRGAARSHSRPAEAPGDGRRAERRELVPSRPEDTLSADGLPYRGVLEVRPGEAGLTVVNVINLEDYLKGVVPNELSPRRLPAARGPEGPGRGRPHVRACATAASYRPRATTSAPRPTLPGLPRHVHREPADRPRPWTRRAA